MPLGEGRETNEKGQMMGAGQGPGTEGSSVVMGVLLCAEVV